MAVNTKNIDLVKPGTDEFYDVNIMNGNLDKIDSYTGEIKSKLENGFIQEKALQLGYNRIQIPEIPVSPKIEFTGFSYVNLLGKDGNFETYAIDAPKGWIKDQPCAAVLDSTWKKFGENSMKLTMTLSGYNLHRYGSGSPSKYYLFKFFAKSDTANCWARILTNNGTIDIWASTCVEINVGEGEYGVLFQVSSAGKMDVVLGQNIAQTANVNFDGLMVTEVSASDYDAGLSHCMAKYPYIDAYACLQNPYFENRRYNLVRNGNCEDGIGYWCAGDSAAGKLSVENGKFKIVPAGAYGYFYQEVPVKANINYYISCNVSTGGGMSVYNADRTMQIRGGSGTFSVSTDTKVVILIGIGTVLQPIYFDSAMLAEGTTPPVEYKSCDLQRFVVEGQFTQEDKIVIDNGKVSGLLNWKHKTLYGKDYDWQFGGDYTSYKYITLSNGILPHPQVGVPASWAAIKYNGAVLVNDLMSTGADRFYHGNSDITYFSIGDADSGWVESINPNADEVKAFMNGWKAIAADGISRYIAWRLVGTSTLTGLEDFPPCSATTLSVETTIGATSITVADAGIFKNGDILFTYGGGSLKVTGISGNVISLNAGVAAAFPVGNVVLRADNPSAGDTRILTYCKNNLAPGYEGYRLHYKLANPEAITDTNVHVEGEIWDLVKGDNYVTIDSGIELGEVANYVITGGYVYMNEDYPTIYSPFRNKVENSDVIIYKNGLPDIHKWTPETSHGYGNYRFYTAVNNFDVNAIYTADYQILKTLHAQVFGSLSLSYPQSIISALESHSKILEQKQQKDSTLDTIINSSTYERGYTNFWIRFSQNVSGAYHSVSIPVLPKTAIPAVSLSNIVVNVRDSGGNAIPSANKTTITITPKRNVFSIGIIISDGTLAQQARDYGCAVAFDWIADCRGRV